MKLLKPSWVNHNDKPIFSVDIHPTGKRFATGGQGGDSGRIVVWNLNPVLFESIEMDPNVPKMLCQMDNHLACVNCVRWSNNGHYLASGGDDRLVMIWALSGAAATPGSKVKAETWRCVSTLRGHAGDVLDLAWSPLDKWLASCSVDNSVIIWNAKKFPEMVCVLNGHTGLVKGVAWDPVGKYLASQSDDKSLRVWKTADWGQESIITEPFEECGGTTHVLRLSWSPDGQYVVSAHAMNGGGPTAQVVERDGWRCDKDFVGHRKAVTCARFNNNILVKDGKKCCCAGVGSRDRSLSIWLTSLKRPLVVVHDLFQDSVLDISWSADGLNLLACSSDGTVACIQFTNKEIGTPLTIDEKNAFYEKIYGKCVTHDSAGVNTSSLLLECPEIMLAREKDKAKKDNLPKNENSQSSQWSRSSARPTARPVDRQIETRTSDGKRRITPVFIPDPEPSESLGAAPPEAFSTSSQSKSRIVVERRDDIVLPPNVSSLPGGDGPPAHHDNQSSSTTPTLRKRPATSLPGPRTLELSHSEPKRAATGENQVQATPTPGPVLPVPVLGTVGPVVRAAGQYRVQVLNNSVSTPYGKLSRLQLLPINSASSDIVWETYLGSSVSCISCSARWVCVSCADRSFHVWRLRGGGGGGAARHMPPIALQSLASKMVVRGDTVVLVTSCGTLWSWRLAPPTTSPAQSDHAPLAQTESVQVTPEAAHPPLPVAHLIPRGVNVTNLTLLDDGSPLMSLSNGKTYIYCKNLLSWLIWQDAGDATWRLARGSTSQRAARDTLSAQHAPPTPVGSDNFNANKFAGMAGMAGVSGGSGWWRAGAALSWAERSAAAAAALHAPRDYRHWLLAAAALRADHGSERSLRAMLDPLLGPAHGLSRSRTWPDSILGLKKHDLLEEILGIIVRNLRWQRLYAEYSEQLRDLRDAEKDLDGIAAADGTEHMSNGTGGTDVDGPAHNTAATNGISASVPGTVVNGH